MLHVRGLAHYWARKQLGQQLARQNKESVALQSASQVASRKSEEVFIRGATLYVRWNDVHSWATLLTSHTHSSLVEGDKIQQGDN